MAHTIIALRVVPPYCLPGRTDPHRSTNSLSLGRHASSGGVRADLGVRQRRSRLPRRRIGLRASSLAPRGPRWCDNLQGRTHVPTLTLTGRLLLRRDRVTTCDHRVRGSYYLRQRSRKHRPHEASEANRSPPTPQSRRVLRRDCSTHGGHRVRVPTHERERLRRVS